MRMDNIEGTPMEQVVEQVVEKPARPVLPLVALLALASALGVAAAIVLAAVAMLLAAAPAYAEEGKAPDGGLLLERSAGLAWADRLFAESELHDNGYTRVVEEYHNPYDEPLVGVYLYRLPPHAVIERLVFTLPDIGPRHAVLTRRQAGALVERTAEIGPGETLTVELEYRAVSEPRLLTWRDARDAAVDAAVD
jgi:hypothetical protein